MPRGGRSLTCRKGTARFKLLCADARSDGFDLIAGLFPLLGRVGARNDAATGKQAKAIRKTLHAPEVDVKRSLIAFDGSQETRVVPAVAGFVVGDEIKCLLPRRSSNRRRGVQGIQPKDGDGD